MQVKGNHLIRTKASRQITIDPMTPTLINPTSACNLGKYYIPRAKNNPMFDACVLFERSQIALQFTVSASHSIKPGGFEILKGVLPSLCDEQAFVFVIPKGREEKFSCDKPSGDLQNKFKYYVLPLEDMMGVLPVLSGHLKTENSQPP